ncbi:MAG: hypothetical protein IPH38_20490 [Candidatus Microthrix sp.]|nr:hypothetical protein [Candidatus Microthrix sp.]MBK7021891.1 hypothetical protein [Candidatus Microthrix sp.]
MPAPSHASQPILAKTGVGCRELCSGIDALYLSGIGAAPVGLLDELDVLKAEAVESGAPVDSVLGGYPVRVIGTAMGKYRYCVAHELARFGFTPLESLPAVRVQPTSHALHGLGPEGTIAWVRGVLANAGIDVRLQVARLDLHSDWQGLWIEAEERSNFVTYSDRRSLYEVAEDLSGLNFGKRGAPLYARLYDKTREMEAKGDDWWLDVWGSAYRRGDRVLRVEFEFTRQGLKEFGVTTPEDAFDQVGPLWAYATGRWLSLRVPADDATRARWPVDPRWTAVQQATLAGAALPAERIRAGENAGTMRRLLPGLVGYLSGAAVPLGTFDIEDTLEAIRPYLDAYAEQTGVWFDQRVADKRRQL